MRTNKDKSLIWIVAIILGICVLAASCGNKSSDHKCDCLEYQIRLEMDSAFIYDGDRYVGALPFDSTQAFDKLMILDNQ